MMSVVNLPRIDLPMGFYAEVGYQEVKPVNDCFQFELLAAVFDSRGNYAVDNKGHQVVFRQVGQVSRASMAVSLRNSMDEKEYAISREYRVLEQKLNHWFGEEMVRDFPTIKQTITGGLDGFLEDLL